MYNVPDIGPGKKEYATKRDLSLVFEHHKCKEYGFTMENTLVIDSEFEKVRNYPNNAVVIKAYDLEEVKLAHDDQTAILLEVRDWVFGLLESTQGVPSYL